jgi:hypothetical protein
LQVSTKDTVQWAYMNDASEEWVIVDKSVVESATDIPADVEKGKAIGFEGKPDPASGFYCRYNQGRIVDETNPRDKSPTGFTASKKLAD